MPSTKNLDLSVLHRLSTKCNAPKRSYSSLTCRGLAIDEEAVFRYTNGRFLKNEKFELDRRYVKFNLDALCEVAAAAGEKGLPSPISSVEKMEGGLSKVLLMKKQNGSEVIAKIPCRNAGPRTLTTESEVAVLKFVSENTTIPVPKVLSWSSAPANAVGAEYIIMEKVSGVQLYKLWAEIPEYYKLELIKSLTQYEHQLSSVSFPGYGGLYLVSASDSIDNPALKPSLNVAGDLVESSFRVGASSERTYWLGPNDELLDVDPGPWTSLSDFGIAIANRELNRISKQKRSADSSPFYYGTTEEQRDLLKKAIEVFKLADFNPRLGKSAAPTLLHTELHMSNIFVSPETPFTITSFIDWQSISIKPAFMQARWPVFLKPDPDSYPDGFVQPLLPPGFEQMDEEVRRVIETEHNRAKMAKAYEVSAYLENHPGYEAMMQPPVFRELFNRCAETWESGVLPLRACLIEAQLNWTDLGFPNDKPCPYNFTETEIAAHGKQFEGYEEWHGVREEAIKDLETDAEGWISPEVDFEQKKQLNKDLFEDFAKSVAGTKTVEEAKSLWPFRESL